MKRNAVALAVAALSAAPAVQAQITMGNETVGTVQIYGKLYPEFIVAKGQGSSQPGDQVSTLVSASGILGGAAQLDHGQRNAIDSQSSFLGFRGERKLGGGLKGIWQLEQSIEIDSGTGTFSSRNSFVGLSHGTLGTVKLGKMDTIYKEYGDTFNMFGISAVNFVSASNVLSNIGIGNGTASRFPERLNNTLQYQSAEFAGVQAGIQYMPDEKRGDPGRGPNANVWSYGVKYDSKMFYASLHQEIHNDFYGASLNIPDATIANVTSAQVSAGTTGDVHSRDQATRFTGELRISDDHRFVVDIARLKYSETGQAGAGKFQQYKKPNWAVGYDMGYGAWRFATQYVRAGSGTCQLIGGMDCSTTNLQSWMLTLGARYRFDRQTFVYAIAAKLSNGTAARMDNWNSTDPNRGEDVKQLALGINYSF